MFISLEQKVKWTLITKMKNHMSDYMRVFGTEERFNYIMNDF